MKRWPILALAALALTLAPKTSTDVGDLLPVELVYLYKEGNEVWVDTDAGVWGHGPDLASALADLRDTAPGEVFLDTADYLILAPEAMDLVPELTGVLRPATEVCMGLHADVYAAAFLAAHSPGVTLGELRSGDKKLPILTRREAGYRIAF